MRGKQPVWVILRADLFHGPNVELRNLVTAKAVVRDEEFARAEVERLNKLHPDSSVVYSCQMSRLVEPD